MTVQSNSLSQTEGNWNPSPSKNEGSFGYEATNRLLLYGFLGYLPEDASDVLILSGPKQAEIAILLEQNGYGVTMLCDPDADTPGCIQRTISEMEPESFDAIVFPGWLTDHGNTEKLVRDAKDALREKGLLVGSFAGRFAAAIEIAGQSAKMAKSISDGEESGNWHGACELYSPNEAILMLEAVGFEVVDMFGWQLALSRMPHKMLHTSDWTDDQLDEICDLEFRLGQERSIMGCAPTIQFIAKKITGEPEELIGQA
jgi:hypothetical protein